MKAKEDARRRAALNLGPEIGVKFYLGEWSHRAEEAFNQQWRANGVKQPYPEGGWSWPEIFRRHRDLDAMSIAIWTGDESDRLSGLGLATATREAVTARFIEGDPRGDCPLQGSRALIVLEAASCYAQVLGCKEIRVEPANERLTELYQEFYGFTLVRPRKGIAYCFKGV